MDNEVFKIYKETTHKRWGHRVYEVSNLGRVRLNGEIVEPRIYNGYYEIGPVKIHRAVAKLFIPNPDNKPCVDHINTNTLDNRVENLRWVTPKENNNNPLTRKHKSESKKGRPSGMLGKVHSADTRRKISESNKGKIFTEESRAKISATLKGRHLSEETKLKISASFKARHNRLANEKEHTMKK